MPTDLYLRPEELYGRLVVGYGTKEVQSASETLGIWQDQVNVHLFLVE